MEEGNAIADVLDFEDPGVEAVVEVGGKVGDFVGEVDQLGFEGGIEIEEIGGELGMRGGRVVARVLNDAFAHSQREIKSAECGITLFKPGDDPESMEVVVEAERVMVQSLIKRLFTGVAEGRVAYVVGEGEGFREFLVEAESGGDGAGDLGDFEGMSEAAAEVIGGKTAGVAREDLGLSGKAAERSGVENAGAIASKRGPIGMIRFRELAGCKLSFALDSDAGREKEAGGG
jgi:hypothetical protein